METIKIEGMSCKHCVMAVKKAIESLNGVQSAEVDLEAKQAIVDFDEKKLKLEDIRAAIQEAGYETV
jgi:copper chaperone